MDLALTIGEYVVIFYAGLAVGFFLKGWLLNKSGFDGDIIVTKEGDKTLYSLELHEDPRLIQYQNEVILKVKMSSEELNRD